MSRRLLQIGILSSAIGIVLLLAFSVFAPSTAGDPGPLRTLMAALSAPRADPTDPDGASYVVDLPLGLPRSPAAPWHVALQVGHLDANRLPPEQAHLQDDDGAFAPGYKEADVNHAIADLAAADLRRAGVTVDVLPATVPPGLSVDAFVAIHADGSTNPGSRGWKIATPWMTSEASRLLEAEVAAAYAQGSGLPEDRYGVSYFMKGYYAFNWRRYRHAIAPTTPAAIIETGFLTSPADREVIVKDPGRVAHAIASGIILFLSKSASLPPVAFVPKVYPPLAVAKDGAPLRLAPGEGERISRRLDLGTALRVFDEENGWVEVMVWGDYRVFGWVNESDLRI